MAASSYLLWTDKVSGAPRFVKYDVVEAETHTYSSEITEHPIEEDSNVTDHVIRNLDEYHVEVLISGSPIDFNSLTHNDERSGATFGTVALDYPPLDQLQPFPLTPGAVFNAVGSALGGLLGLEKALPSLASVLNFPEGAPSPEFVYDELTTLWERAILVEIITPFRVYEDMVITNIDVPRKPTDGDSLRTSITFKKIRKVKSRLVSAPAASIKRAEKPKEKGKQDAPVVNDPKQTFEKEVLDKVLGDNGAGYFKRGLHGF